MFSNDEVNKIEFALKLILPDPYTVDPQPHYDNSFEFWVDEDNNIHLQTGYGDNGMRIVPSNCKFPNPPEAMSVEEFKQKIKGILPKAIFRFEQNSFIYIYSNFPDK